MATRRKRKLMRLGAELWNDTREPTKEKKRPRRNTL
jgi:hypothetical protein